MSRRNGNRSRFHIDRKRRLVLRARQRAIKAALLGPKVETRVAADLQVGAYADDAILRRVPHGSRTVHDVPSAAVA